MQNDKVILPALVGTSAMTLFSYLVSEAENRNYREPEVLKLLIDRLPQGSSKTLNELVGWGAHYGAGIIFELVFNEIWKRRNVKPSLTSGTLAGLASGVAGVIVWKGLFMAHPNPPKINLNKYFGHLILAHVVFGFFSALTYKLISTKENS